MNSQNITKNSVIYNIYHHISIFLKRNLDIISDSTGNENLCFERFNDYSHVYCHVNNIHLIMISIISKDHKIANRADKLFEILKIFETYLGYNLEYNDNCYCKIVIYDSNEINCSKIIKKCHSIEELFNKCLTLSDEKYVFSLCFKDINENLLSEKNVKKLEKNGIIFTNDMMYISDINIVKLTKLKKNLNLKKYCEEIMQNNMINEFKTKDIFIYFE